MYFLPMIKKLLSYIALLLGCLALSSCFETDQEITLNPDGTGKMVINTSFPNVSLNGKITLDDTTLNKTIADFLSKSEGIEAWKDVSYSWGDDGRIKFKGTGYFSDVSSVKIHNAALMTFAWESDGKTGKLTMDFKKDDAKDKKAIAKDPAERAKEIKAERAQFQQSKPMLSGILAQMKHTATFHLPGKAGKTDNFVTAADGRLGLKITGTKMIEAMEKLVNDDAWMAKNGFDAQSGPQDSEALSETLFGSKAPVSAERLAMGAPIFDYQKELTTAKADMAKLEKLLGPKIAPAAAGQPFKSLEVAGVRLIRQAKGAPDLRAFNYDPGFALSLIGKFSGSVLDVTDKSTLLKAIADDGSNLLPDSDFDRKINFPRFSEDQSAVNFDIDLLTPPDSAKGIREISGTLQYIVATGTKEVELGFASLKAGESGKALEAEIKEIKNGWNNGGSKQIEIELAVDKSSVKELILIEGKNRTVLEQRGYSSFGNTAATFTFEAKKGIPETGRLVVVLHDGMKTYDIPFKLENLTLLGTPAEK